MRQPKRHIGPDHPAPVLRWGHPGALQLRDPCPAVRAAFRAVPPPWHRGRGREARHAGGGAPGLRSRARARVRAILTDRRNATPTPICVATAIERGHGIWGPGRGRACDWLVCVLQQSCCGPPVCNLARDGRESRQTRIFYTERRELVTITGNRSSETAISCVGDSRHKPRRSARGRLVTGNSFGGRTERGSSRRLLLAERNRVNSGIAISWAESQKEGMLVGIF